MLLVGCAFAACYTTAGRVLRSLTRRAVRTDRAAQALADLADSGPLAEAVARLARPLARRLPAFAPPALALLGAGALTATAALAPRGSWWAVRRRRAVRPDLRTRRRPAADGRPGLAGPAVLPGRRVRNRAGPGSRLRR